MNATGWATPVAALAGVCNVGAASGFTVNVPLAVAPPNDPEMLTAVVLETVVVVIVKVLLVAPAGTVTLGGTVAAAELSESVTTAPPEGAAPLRVTVPVDEAPPTTVDGLSESVEMVTAGARVMLSAANRVVLPSVAVSCAVVLSTGNVVTVNDALVAPAGTVTVAGTLADPGRLLLRLTVAPPDGAAVPRVTVPVADVPPGTLVGLTEKPVSAGTMGTTMRSADWVTPPPVAEIVTTVRLVTALVVMKKIPTSVDAGTVANCGTDATAGLLLVNRNS